MEEIGLSSVCVPSPNVVSREIEGEVVIVPLVAGIADAQDDLYTLNDTGRAIWRLLDGEHTLRQVVDELAGQFDVSPSILERDVRGFASEMISRGIIAEIG